MYMYNDNYDYREEKKRELKEEEFCVQVNIFCDENKKEHKEDDCKKERKEEEFCVQVNIFCDKCKKNVW